LRAPIRSDRLIGTIGGREREAEIVVELGLVGNGLRRAREDRDRRIEVASLIKNDTEVMQRGRMIGRSRERGTVLTLGGGDVAALVLSDCGGDPSIGIRRRQGPRRRAAVRERAVALLVFPATAAGTRLVATDDRKMPEIRH
jgi:hypothetical protein